MKTPIWAYVSGIFMILFGVYQAYSSIQLFNALRVLDIIENISDTDIMEKFILSDYERMWNIRFVYIGLLVWFIFIIGGIFLLFKKTYSIKLAYAAIALSIFFYISQLFVFEPSGILFGLLVDFILLVSDKTAFYSEDEFEG